MQCTHWCSGVRWAHVHGLQLRHRTEQVPPQLCMNKGALAAFEALQPLQHQLQSCHLSFAADLANTSTTCYSTCCSPCYTTCYRVSAAALTEEAVTVPLLTSFVKRKPKLVAVACARFDRLPAAQLPPLWLVYSNSPSDSGAVHSPVKSRWLVDQNVRREMAQIAALADQGRYGLVRCHVTLQWSAVLCMHSLCFGLSVYLQAAGQECGQGHTALVCNFCIPSLHF